MARSVAPKSSAPASEVIAPASNAAITSRPSTASNPKKSGLHSVGIGALRESTIYCCDTTVFVDSQRRCTQLCEKSALAGASILSACGLQLLVLFPWHHSVESPVEISRRLHAERHILTITH